MNDHDFNDYDEPGFFRKYGLAIGVAVVLLLAVGAGFSIYLFAGKVAPPKKPVEIAVKLLPPPPLPPPPPPPPKEPPPPEPKMVEQPPVKPDEQKPKDEPKNLDKPPGPPGPVASGPPSDYGLAGSGGGGNGLGGGGEGGSRWGWYAGKIQQAVAEAVRQNEKTREAKLRLKVRIWADRNGRISRAQLADSSGDSAIDDVLKTQVLTGLILPEPPPTDMPMPIVLRINAQRPN